MKSFLVAVGAVVLIFAVGIGYYLLKPKPQEIGIEFTKPDQVQIGQPFALGISLSNLTDKIVTDAKLSVTLPEGISFIGRAVNQRVAEQVVGDLGPGSLTRQEMNLIALADTETIKRVEAKVVYGTGARAQFSAQSGVDLVLDGPAILLDFAVPGNVVSGENFTVTVRAENRANADFAGLRLKMEYPPVFQFQRASVGADAGNNFWNLGALPKNASTSFTISGNIAGGTGTFYEFRGTLTADFLGQSYAVSRQAVKVAIASSPLSLSIAVNGATDYVATLGDTLNYVLTYRNDSSVAMENVTIHANFIGEMFDFSAARSGGFLNSITNTFTWNTANTPALRAVPPGGNGTVTTQIGLKDSYPIRRLSDKNFTLQVRGQIESPTVPSGGVAEKTLSVAALENKVQGLLTIDAPGYFRDAKSGILNAGPYPPRVNQATQYTVHWIIKNYATDVTGVKVSAFLQSNTRFTGKVLSTVSAMPLYDPASGEIRWEVGDVPATKGVLGQPIEAVFQVENTPAANQAGQRVTLLSQTRITGQDAFTGAALTGSASAVATDLPDDPTIEGGDSGVQP